jgi:hypothetical protein
MKTGRWFIGFAYHQQEGKKSKCRVGSFSTAAMAAFRPLLQTSRLYQYLEKHAVETITQKDCPQKKEGQGASFSLCAAA